MILKFQHYLCGISFSLGLCFVSCSDSKYDCAEKPAVTYNLSAEERTKIPYKANDILIFISDGGDTAELHIDSSGLKQSYYVDNSYDASSNPDCPSQSLYYENNKVNIAGSALIRSIYLNAYYYNGPSLGTSHSLDIILNYNGYNADIYTVELTSLNDAYYTDTVSIKGTGYNGFKISTTNGSELIYNHYQGILRIKSPDNKIWTAMF